MQPSGESMAAASTSASPSDAAARRAWMAVLARARPQALEAALAARPDLPAYRLLRGPETGLVMVRGRAGGTGGRFNLGEMTVTRCTVATATGYTGHAYVAGRDRRHAELAAVFDALLQDPGLAPALDREVVRPVAEELERRHAARAGKVAGTRVDFFTLVRGEDARE